MNNYWRLVLTGFSDAYTNMAVDEAIFLSYCQKNSLPTLRLYGWQLKAFSLGYAQKAEKELDIDKCRKEKIDFVRRITGGGIIFHHQELTYSLACSQEDIGIGFSIPESFRILCGFLLAAYKKLNLKACYARENKLYNERFDVPSSFCFASRARYDILINAKKIGGNAQRRYRNFIFQHGSVPLKFDIEEAVPFLKENPRMHIKERICSLQDALGRIIEFKELAEIIRESFKETFLVNLEEGNLTAQEKNSAEILKEKKYSTLGWNLGYRKENAYQPQEALLAE